MSYIPCVVLCICIFVAYFLHNSSYLLTLRLYCPSPHALFPLVTTSLFYTFVSLLLLSYSLVCWVLQVPCISDIIQSLPFPNLLHLAQYLSSPPMLLQMANFHSLLWLSSIPLYSWTTSSLVLCAWTLRLPPYLGYCK